jgi:hypothetical protein
MLGEALFARGASKLFWKLNEEETELVLGKRHCRPMRFNGSISLRYPVALRYVAGAVELAGYYGIARPRKLRFDARLSKAR